jgi:hypothetical protein
LTMSKTSTPWSHRLGLRSPVARDLTQQLMERSPRGFHTPRAGCLISSYDEPSHHWLRRSFCADGDSVPALDHRHQFPVPSMQAPLGSAAVGGARREERSPYGRLLFLSCLHQRRIAGAGPRVVLGFLCEGCSSKSQRIGEGLLATECDCRIKLTAPSLLRRNRCYPTDSDPHCQASREVLRDYRYPIALTPFLT